MKKIIAMCGSIGIYDIDYNINDYVITRDFKSEKSRKVKNQIYYNLKGEPYFLKYGIRFYLNNFFLVDIDEKYLLEK